MLCCIVSRVSYGRVMQVLYCKYSIVSRVMQVLYCKYSIVSRVMQVLYCK